MTAPETIYEKLAKLNGLANKIADDRNALIQALEALLDGINAMDAEETPLGYMLAKHTLEKVKRG